MQQLRCSNNLNHKNYAIWYTSNLRNWYLSLHSNPKFIPENTERLKQPYVLIQETKIESVHSNSVIENEHNIAFSSEVELSTIKET